MFSTDESSRVVKPAAAQTGTTDVVCRGVCARSVSVTREVG